MTRLQLMPLSPTAGEGEEWTGSGSDLMEGMDWITDGMDGMEWKFFVDFNNHRHPPSFPLAPRHAPTHAVASHAMPSTSAVSQRPAAGAAWVHPPDKSAAATLRPWNAVKRHARQRCLSR